MKPPDDSVLLTDFYELTMLQAYRLQDMNGEAVFEFFVRSLPEQRSFLLAAGLEQVVGYLSRLRFTEEDLAWLRASGRFDTDFVRSLADFRFTGHIDAMPEGTVFFADEPILRVTAPLREAQYIESRLMNLLHFQTMVASKAARTVLAANGKRLIDFGLRRAHGAEAALLSARASYIAGFDGTATALAAAVFGIPVYGTMAHSFIQAHDFEPDAFSCFARAFPDATTLLIDTYDIQEAARSAGRLARWLREEENIRIRGVRIDSGDLADSSRRVRAILDAEGCEDMTITASGNLDEYAVHALTRDQAPIDAFGVGTRMNTSADAPFLDCAYKLVEYEGRPRRKRSSAKATWPGRKQVFRTIDAAGCILEDVIGLRDEAVAGVPLLQPVVRDGVLVSPLPSLSETRQRARAGLDTLRAFQRDPSLSARPLRPSMSPAVRDLARRADATQQARAAEADARWGFESE